MIQERRRVILLCSRKPIVAEFMLLAESIAEERCLKSTVLIPEGLRSMLPAVLPAGSEVMTSGYASWRNRGVLAAVRYAFHAALRRVAKIFRSGIVRDFLETWEANSRGKWIGRHLLQICKNDAALLLADDRDIRVDQGILAIAREQKVFTMTVSFGQSSPKADSGQRTSRQFDLDLAPYRVLKRYISKCYPESVRVTESGRRILFLRPGEYFALKLHGTLLPVPWSYGGGASDVVAVADARAATDLEGLGVPKEKIFVAGQCSHDELWSTLASRQMLRASLNERYELDASCKLIVLSMPALGEHGIIPLADQVRLSKDLVGEMAKVEGANVLVSLHPRQGEGAYNSLVTGKVRLLREPLRGVIAAADLFVAYSSTIEWAQLLGVPAVALECFGIPYSLFKDQPGVRVVNSLDKVAPTCISLLSSGVERAAALSELDAFREHSLFDGRARARILSQVKSRLSR